MTRPLVIGTRGSPLALWQAHEVRRRLSSALGIDTGDAEHLLPVTILRTSGDRITGELSAFGGKGLFTRELEQALLDRRIDVAVHSMKDVPTVGQPGLAIGAILPRADPRDAFLSPAAPTLLDLPERATVGSASIRRRAQAARLRPDLRFVLLRGNVGTRCQRLSEGVCDATFLACAGLDRLGEGALITHRIPLDVMLPAPAQGAVGIEFRRDDADVADALGRLDHAPTRRAITAERGFLRALDGSCRTPIAALAQTGGDGEDRFRGEVLSPDGTLSFTADEPLSGDPDEAGFAIGQRLRDEIGGRIVFDEGTPLP